MNEKHYQTGAKDRLSVSQKLLYGLGAFSNNLLGTATGSLTIALNLGLGMDPGKIGLLGSIPRVADAITDPMMGYISDHTRSRWGRRRPYIFIGSIFCGLLFTLLWSLPSLEEKSFMGIALPEAGSGVRDAFYFWYFLFGSILFYLAYTVWVTPWVALGYELTADYHERTRVMGWSNFVGQTAYLLTPWFLWFMQRQQFGGIMRGATTLALLISIVVVVIGVVSSIFLKEQFYEGLCKNEQIAALKSVHRQTEVSISQNIGNFFKGFWAALKFMPFVKLCITVFLIFNGFMLVSSFSIYVLIYYVCQGDQELGGKLAGQGGTITAISAFIIVIIVTKLGTHFGKKKALLITTGISVVGYLSKWWLFTPDMPHLSLLPGPLIAFGFGGLFPLVGAMIADVCDLDELQSYERREGMFGSIFWWVIKVGMAAALAIGGYMLNWTGFDVAFEKQSLDTQTWLRIGDAVVPALTSLLAMAVVFSFDLSEEKAHEVREELEKRKNEHL